MEKKKRILRNVFLYICIAAALLIYFIPQFKNYGGVMLGRTGLDNTVKALALTILSRTLLIIPIPIAFGIPLVREIKEKGSKFIIMLNAGAVLLLGTVVFGLLGSHYRTYGALTNTPAVISDVSLLFECIGDRTADEYIEYTADEVKFTKMQYITHYSTRGRRKTIKRDEYKLSAYKDGELVFEAQIGKNDHDDMNAHITPTKEIYFTVYKHSGLVRSYTPEVDFASVGYTYMFTIELDGERITRNEPEELPRNLTWCGFKKGRSGMENAVFGINAENSAELTGVTGICDEVCLYAWIDGEYKPVSNTIYFYEE